MKNEIKFIEVLFNSPDSVFSKLVKADKEYLLANTEYRVYKKNEIVFSENT